MFGSNFYESDVIQESKKFTSFIVLDCFFNVYCQKQFDQLKYWQTIQDLWFQIWLSDNIFLRI